MLRQHISLLIPILAHLSTAQFMLLLLAVPRYETIPVSESRGRNEGASHMTPIFLASGSSTSAPFLQYPSFLPCCFDLYSVEVAQEVFVELMEVEVAFNGGGTGSVCRTHGGGGGIQWSWHTKCL